MTNSLLADYIELNMSNYTEDQVHQLQQWATDAHVALHKYQETEEQTDQIKRAAVWTKQYCDQLQKLKEMMYLITMLNKGSDFIGKVQKIQSIAEELTFAESYNPSFTEFLTHCAIVSRTAYVKLNGKVPETVDAILSAKSDSKWAELVAKSE